MLNVFISSTWQDLQEYRLEARNLIAMLGFHDIAMEKWPPNEHPPLRQIEEWLGVSDVFVGIVGWRYGSRIPRKQCSFTEYEYRQAKKLHIPRLLFLTDPKYPWRPELMDRGAAAGEVDKLRQKIEKAKDITWKYFTTPLELIRSLSGALFRTIPQCARFNALAAEDQAVLTLRRLINDDFLARHDELEGSHKIARPDEWFIPEIARCNVGTHYVKRDSIRNEVADWLLRRESSCLLLVGPSGAGKTNFLLELTQIVSSDAANCAPENLIPASIVFLPLGAYDPDRDVLANMVKYANRNRRWPETISPNVLSRLVQSGRSLLILDGLDQLVRNHGEEAAIRLFRSLAMQLNPAASRVILSCRDHIHERLHARGVFGQLPRFEEIDVRALTRPEVVEALERRFSPDSPACLAIPGNPALLEFGKRPLLLEMMCRFSRESWKSLLEAKNLGRLYDLWFQETVAASANPATALHDEYFDLTSAKLGRIAGMMLARRTELVRKDALEREGLPLDSLQTLTRQPLGVFIQQTPDEWSFVHDSFREFALAKRIAVELTSSSYDLLATTASFDYVGAETYAFLNDLLPIDANLFQHIETALQTSQQNPQAWNNIVRNCFEAIGMIADASATAFIDKGLEILASSADQSGEVPPVFPKTKYNIVRCLERLHPSSPQPYCRHAMNKAWGREPNWNCFGAAAVRGFHLPTRAVGFSPPVVYLGSRNDSDAQRQLEVSDCLLRLLEGPQCCSDEADDEPEQRVFLQINCTHALIRWLHQTHIARTRQLLGSPSLDPRARGNLFLAFTRFRMPEVFADSEDLFAGMNLCWVYLSRAMVPENFVFREVVFRKHRECILENFPPSAFELCRND